MLSHVLMLWNWQANVSHFNGRRLKTASGVMWYNKSEAAETLLTAWSQAMAYDANAAAPDDQTLDLLVNDVPTLCLEPCGAHPRRMCMSPSQQPLILRDRAVVDRTGGSTARPSVGFPPRTCA
jgi:hypothetical protein